MTLNLFHLVGLYPIVENFLKPYSASYSSLLSNIQQPNHPYG